MVEVPDHWKAAIVRLTVLGRSGTGYLVAPNRIATCQRLVQRAEEVTISLGATALKARVLGEDREHDVAILLFDGSVDGEPLPLAESVTSRVAFRGFGFSSEVGNPARAFGGIVLRPVTRDDEGRPAMQVYSEMARRGLIAAGQGFSGSPLLADGAVIGHLRRELGARDGPGGPYGVSYAAPVDAVRRLLDMAPVLKAIRPTTFPETERQVEKLGAGHYHAFISYRSTDRGFALSLAKRLEGAALRVFLDQKEIEPGDPLASSLEQAITNSRSAIVLVSKGWLESSWCQKEAKVLKQRSVKQKGFKLIPVRLDDSRMPAFLGDLVWLDFKGHQQAEGSSVDRLIRALVGSSEPGAVPSPTPIDLAETRILDAFLRQLRATAKIGWKAMKRVVDDWEFYGSEDKTPLLEAAELLVGTNLPNKALEVLERAGSGLRAMQLRALALDKGGRRANAIRILEPLYDVENANAETGGILAGIYKRRWRDEGDKAALRRAYELYQETWKHTGDSFNGINTAALTLQLGKAPESQRIAVKVLEALEAKDPSKMDHWELASIGEAHLLNRDLPQARDWYGKAIAKEPDQIQAIAVMRTQARMNLKALGESENALDDVFPIPTVIAFAGHMTDAPDRAEPRFPPTREREVRLAVRNRVQKLGKVYAYCSAARGSDIIFLEEVLERGGYARVSLPFQVEDYKRTSVGLGWDERFDRVVSHEHVELIAPDEAAPTAIQDLQVALSKASDAIYAEASSFAKGLGKEPTMLAVWDGKQGDGPGGTSDAVRFWKGRGHEVDILDVQDPLKKEIPLKEETPSPPPWIRRGMLACSTCIFFVLILLVLGWRTDLVLDTHQARGVKVVPEEVRQSVTFDPSHSAGLFVGVRKFKDGAFSEVPFAADDAVDLAHLFSLELRLIQPVNVVLALSGEPQKWVSKKRLRKLVSEGAKRLLPTRSEVIQQLRDLPVSSGSGGLILVSLATHGFLDGSDDYLLAYDSVGGRVRTTGIPLAGIFEDMSKANAPRRVVFLDACRERLFEVRAEATQRPETSTALADAIAKTTGLAALSATTAGGFSYDDSIEKNGVFTKAIIEGLGGKADQRDGFITVRTLADYVHGRVLSWVQRNRPHHADKSKGIARRIEGDAEYLPLAAVPADRKAAGERK